MDISLCKNELDVLSSSSLSLFNFLNCCRTKSGTKMLRSWIESPLSSIQQINSRLDMVEYFGADGTLRFGLFDILRKMPPITQSLKRLASSNTQPAKLEHCVLLSKYAESALELGSLLSSHQYFSSDFAGFQTNLENLITLVNSSIEISVKSLESEYRVKPNFDETLASINNSIVTIDNEIENLRKLSSQQLGLSKELQTVSADSHGLLFEGNKIEIHSGMRENTKIIFHVVSHLQKNVKITCQELKNLSKQRKEATDSYLTGQIEVEQKIIEIVKGYREFIENVQDTCSFLDCILAISNACFTSTPPYTRPIINTSGLINIKNFRHPSYEQQNHFTPNSISLSKPNSSFTLITGPNMGGKSTFLKQTGLCIILAHIGSFVPAEFASICLIDKVMARMGAGDSQLSGESTFMCEMNELTKVLENATENSLLLIDEIGRGTSTSEGLGIAWGTCEFLSKLGCFTLFATHFSELVNLNLENFSTCQMEVKVGKTVEMTHKVVPGAAENSFGIEIAAMYGLPLSIIEDARSIKSTAEELEKMN